MAGINESTITVQDLLEFARTHIELVPLDGIGGYADEPALTIANKIMKRIINRRYNWEWNRKTITPAITTQEGKDDYILPADDIGWLEEGYYILTSDVSDEPFKYELEMRRKLRRGAYRGRPRYAALDRSDQGVKILRFRPVPDSDIIQAYITYQRKPRKIESLEHTFEPIPDDFEDVLTQYFIAFAYRLVNKNQYRAEMQEANELLMDLVGKDDIETSDSGLVPEFDIYGFV